MELRGVALAEIRRRYLATGADIPASVLQALKADPRSGARALARSIESRAAREQAEGLRLTRLFSLQSKLHVEGHVYIAGVDEVGVGPLAGPVVAASVILPADAKLIGLNDSKKLSATQRERLDREIREQAIDLAIGAATREEIDQYNILHASLLAMRRAVESLHVEPTILLVDARRIPKVVTPQRAIIGGDALVASIAAASIVAKVCRDAEMKRLDQRYPGYGFAQNAGYGTPDHMEALKRIGPTPEHRHSFAPVREASR